MGDAGVREGEEEGDMGMRMGECCAMGFALRVLVQACEKA